MPPRDAADLWRDLVAEAGEDAIAEALRPTDAEVERDLRAAGFDLAQENARAPTLVGPPDAEPQAWEAKVEPAPARPRRVRWVLLLAATLAIAAMGGLVYGLGRRPKPVDNLPAPREVPTGETPPPGPKGPIAPPPPPVSPRPVAPEQGSKEGPRSN